jgi:alkylhydroperoxidase family enzyme
VKAALRWADAYLLHPDEVDDDLRREMAPHFDPAELVELTFALMRFQSGSKLRILFGLTPPIAPGTRS